MDIKKWKDKGRAKIYHGEEVAFKEIPELFKPFSIHNGAIEITSDVLLVKMMEEKDSQLKSLLLYENEIPIVTKRKTRTLMSKYRNQKCEDARIIRHFINDTYGKSFYKRPYISPESMFVPILGDSNKDVSYINLAMVDNIYQNDEGKTVIAFCGDLEVCVDMKFSIVKNTTKHCLEIYTMYYSCDNVFCVNTFKKWRGEYYKRRSDIIKRAIERARKEKFDIIKTKYQFMYKSTDTDKMEIVEKAFFS